MNLIVIIISQCICILNHRIVHLEKKSSCFCQSQLNRAGGLGGSGKDQKKRPEQLGNFWKPLFPRIGSCHQQACPGGTPDSQTELSLPSAFHLCLGTRNILTGTEWFEAISRSLQKGRSSLISMINISWAEGSLNCSHGKEGALGFEEGLSMEGRQSGGDDIWRA